MSEEEKAGWLEKLKEFMSGDLALEVVEKLAELAWYSVLKPMLVNYVKATDNSWDDAIVEKVSGPIEEMLNKISKTDGD